MSKKRTLGCLLAALACGSPSAPVDPDPLPPGGLIPLTQLGASSYLGFEGGLYPGGTNLIPADHAALGTSHARLIQPLDGTGQPDANGKYVLLSVGMSNTTQEFCGGGQSGCSAVSFVGQALADPAVDRTSLEIVDGAQGGQPIEAWDSPADPTYEVVRTQRLAPRGLTEAQVQAAWIKQANPGPTVPLPATNADAYAITAGLGDIVRALKVRYPNLRVAFLSSRIYGGYAAPGTLNPEPFAYESGLGVKWAIEAQILQERGGPPDAVAGDLAPGVAAPWLAWGPYLWANGATARSDGLVWLREDFAADATHPAEGARRKVAERLLDFLKTSPQASCWFLAGRTC